jgi:uncharacterized protein (DUF488 family)
MMRRVSAKSLTVWTLGHGMSEFDDYTEILADHDIELVIDIRSKPLMRFAPRFNRGRLAPALVDAGFQYVYLGDRLGGRPTGDRYYDDDGHTLYAPLNAESWFTEGIERVEQLAAEHNVALTCIEEEPERCHRHLLVGHALESRGTDVQHIRRAGYLESHAELDQRMGVTAASFIGGAWRSPMPMKGGHNRA